MPPYYTPEDLDAIETHARQLFALPSPEDKARTDVLKALTVARLSGNVGEELIKAFLIALPSHLTVRQVSSALFFGD